MAGITLEQAEEQLELWIAADAAVAGGQEYEIDTGSGGRRRLRRSDAAEITNKITYWDRIVKQLSGATARRRTTRAVFE